jgi:hypothetical protein
MLLNFSLKKSSLKNYQVILSERGRLARMSARARTKAFRLNSRLISRSTFLARARAGRQDACAPTKDLKIFQRHF